MPVTYPARSISYSWSMNSSLTLQPQRYVLNSAELRRPLVATRKEVKPPATASRVLNLRFSKDTSRVFFFRSLATMINAGVPLSRALALVASGEDDAQLKQVAQGVSIAVNQGLPVSAALAQHPRCFPRFQCALIRAGEQSGSLVRVLNHLADHEEARQTTERTVRKALTYPLFILATALALLMVAGLVFSNLESLFAGFGVKLPLLAKALIGTGQLLASPWLWVILAGLGYALRKQLSELWEHSEFVQARARFYDRVPGLGSALRAAATVRFARSLSLQMNAGIPISRSLKAAFEASADPVLAEHNVSVNQAIYDGKSLARALQLTGRFSPLFLSMVETGEQAGKTTQMLERAVALLEEELTHRVHTALSLLEPLALAGLGLLVGSFIISLLAPIGQVLQVL